MMREERLTTLYTATVPVAGLVVLAAATLATDLARVDLLLLVSLAVLAGVAQRLPIFLFRDSAVSVAFSATMAAYIVLGPGPALLVNLVSAAVNAVTPRRKPLPKALFNAGAFTLSAAVAAATYALVGGETPARSIVPTIAAAALSGLAHFVANSALVAGAIALTTRTNPLEVWRENYAWMIVNWMAASLNGAALALAYGSLQFFGAAVFVLPLAAAWYSFHLYVQKSQEVRRRNEELHELNAALERSHVDLQEAHLAAVKALAGALEVKDRRTHGHATATTHHAVALARRLGLASDEVESVELGALLHDIGEIGVPEHILRKEGGLSDAEWSEIRRHPTVGAGLLHHVPALARARPIVLAHHERWDGSGYPLGLGAKEIPLAARIVAVADAFNAMTSSRPYRGALSGEHALAELRRGAGTQFDPDVVESFLALIRQETAASSQRSARPRPPFRDEVSGLLPETDVGPR